MVTFLTVLKYKDGTKPENFSSGYAIYKPVHAYALKRQIELHYPHPHRFICLTDFDDMKCETIKLKHGLIGWWSKMELFQPELVAQNPDDVTFYMDLDTCLVGDISCYIDAPYKFAALAEVQAPGLVSGRLGSGVMAWRGDWSVIYQEFVKDIPGNMARYQVGGDQHIINDTVVPRGGFVPMQTIDAGCINYKHNLPDKENPPANAKILYYHGEPKPWQVKHRWHLPGLYDINSY